MKENRSSLQDKVQIIVKGEDKTDDILARNESDGKIHITYSNGKTYSYNANNVQIIHSTQSNDEAPNRFLYLKRIAQAVGLKYLQGDNILERRYEKIDYSNKESILYTFLNGKLNNSNQVDMPTIVYPFSFNKSQQTAVDNALSNPLTIIEGPPGTGKTQTILNIIANAVMDGKSIAVVSSNNSATANVLEKLKSYSVDFIRNIWFNTPQLCCG